LAENFKAFIASFNKDLDESIAKYTKKADDYRSAREVAIKLPDPLDLTIGTNSFKTAGELFAWVYPNEFGGVQNIPYGDEGVAILLAFSGKDASDDSKKNYTILKKNWNGITNLNRANQTKTVGADKWLDTFKSQFYKQLSLSNLKVSEIKAEDFEDVLSATGMSAEYGDQSLLYSALVTPEEKSSPGINEVPTADTPTETPSAQINEAQPAPIAAESASAINPEQPAKSKPEEVKKTESAVIGEKAEVPTEEATPQAPININLETKEEAVVAPPTPVSSIQSQLTLSENTTVSSEKTTIVEQPSVQPAAPVSSPINGSNQTGSTNSTTSIGSTNSQVTNSLNQIFGGMSSAKELAEIEKSLVSNVENEKSIESTTSTNATINESSENLKKSDSQTNSTSSTLNEEVNNSKTSKTKADIEAEERYIKSFLGIEEEKPKGYDTASSETTIQTTGQTTSLGQEKSPSVEVTKSPPSFSEKIMSNTQPAATSESGSAPAMSMTGPVSLTEVKEPSTMVQNETPLSSPGAAQPAPTAASNVGIDISALEYRLSRLEYLLSSPLEVKIVE